MNGFRFLTCAVFVCVIGMELGRGDGSRDASLHERMCDAAKPPPGVMQVQLAHIGHIDTAAGRYEVAVQKSVITGMLSPRGITELLLFNRDCEVVRSYWIPNGEPLWCDGGKIYWRGRTNIGRIEMDPGLAAQFAHDEMPVGNVLDFSQGIDRAFITEELRYGNTGGIIDQNTIHR